MGVTNLLTNIMDEVHHPQAQLGCHSSLYDNWYCLHHTSASGKGFTSLRHPSLQILHSSFQPAEWGMSLSDTAMSFISSPGQWGSGRKCSFWRCFHLLQMRETHDICRATPRLYYLTDPIQPEWACHSATQQCASYLYLSMSNKSSAGFWRCFICFKWGDPWFCRATQGFIYLSDPVSTRVGHVTDVLHIFTCQWAITQVQLSEGVSFASNEEDHDFLQSHPRLYYLSDPVQPEWACHWCASYLHPVNEQSLKCSFWRCFICFKWGDHDFAEPPKALLPDRNQFNQSGHVTQWHSNVLHIFICQWAIIQVQLLKVFHLLQMRRPWYCRATQGFITWQIQFNQSGACHWCASYLHLSMSSDASAASEGFFICFKWGDHDFTEPPKALLPDRTSSTRVGMSLGDTAMCFISSPVNEQ